MKIETNETALGWMGQVRMEVMESGHAYLDHSWQYQNARAPFSRLYFVKTGEGILDIGAQRVVLRPRHAYLIPAGLNYDYHCDSHMEKWYFHITIRMPDGFDLFQGCHTCYQKEISDQEMERMEEDYGKRSLDRVFALQGELMKTMGEMICLAGLAGKEVRSYSSLVQNVFLQVEKAMSQRLNVGELAQALNISPSTLAKRFKKETDMSIGAYLDQILFNQACRLLLTSDLTVGQISDRLGFCDPFYFSRYFRRHQKETPTGYRSRMKGLR